MKVGIWAALALIGGGVACTSRPSTSGAASKNSQVIRSRVSGERPWEYSIFDGGPAARGHVLYYFHGHGGNLDTWLAETTELRAALQKHKTAITVIALTFGHRWFLVPKNGSPSSGLYEVFRNEVVPTVEKLVAQPIRRRSAIGTSMGGFNAFQVLSRMPNFFADVALLSPAFLAVSPYSDPSVIDDFVVRTARIAGGRLDRWLLPLGWAPRTKSKVTSVLAAQGEFLPDSASWNEAAPTVRVTHLSSEVAPRLYISYGVRDEWGFFEAAATVANVAKARQIDITSVPLQGGHSAKDVGSLTQFLVDGHRKIRD